MTIGNASNLENIMFFCTNGNFLNASKDSGVRKDLFQPRDRILRELRNNFTEADVDSTPPALQLIFGMCSCCRYYFFKSCFRVSLFYYCKTQFSSSVTPQAMSDTCFVFDLCLSSSGDSEEGLAADSAWEQPIVPPCQMFFIRCQEFVKLLF